MASCPRPLESSLDSALESPPPVPVKAVTSGDDSNAVTSPGKAENDIEYPGGGLDAGVSADPFLAPAPGEGLDADAPLGEVLGVHPGEVLGGHHGEGLGAGVLLVEVLGEVLGP